MEHLKFKIMHNKFLKENKSWINKKLRSKKKPMETKEDTVLNSEINKKGDLGYASRL